MKRMFSNYDVWWMLSLAILASNQFPSREALETADRMVARINPYEIPSLPAVLSRTC